MKRGLIYIITAISSAAIAGGSTIGVLYSLEGQSSNPGGNVLPPEETTNKEKFLTNLLSSSIKANYLDVEVTNLAGKDLTVNFIGALEYDGGKLASGDLSAIKGNGNISVKYDTIDVNVNFNYTETDKIYFEIADSYYVVETKDIGGIIDLVGAMGLTLGEGLDLSGLMGSATTMLDSIQEIETEKGFDYYLDIPNIGTIILSSDFNNLLIGINTESPLTIGESTISISASTLMSVEESYVENLKDTSKFEPVPGLQQFLNTISDVVESKTFGANFNVNIAKESTVYADLNGKISADLNDSPLIQLCIDPKGQILENSQVNTMKVLLKEEVLYFKANELIKGRLSMTSINEIVTFISDFLNSNEVDMGTSGLEDLFSSSYINQILNGNLSNLNGILKDFHLDQEGGYFIFDKNAIGITQEDFRIELEFEKDIVKSIKIQNFVIMDLKINLAIEIEKNAGIAEDFNDLSSFDDYSSSVVGLLNIADLFETKKFLADFELLLNDTSNSYLIAGKLGADINGVDLADLSSINKAKALLSVEPSELTRNKSLNINYQDEVIFLKTNDSFKTAIKNSSISDLFTTLDSKINIGSSMETSDGAFKEITDFINAFTPAIEKVMKGDLTELQNFVKISSSGKEINVILQNNEQQLLTLTLSSDDNNIVSINVSNLKLGGLTLNFNLKFSSFTDDILLSDDPTTFTYIDGLLYGVTNLVEESKFSLGIDGSLIGSDGIETKIDGNIQFDMTSKLNLYGSVDIKGSLPIDKQVNTHHLLFDYYPLFETNQSEMLVKYYENDNTGSPMRMTLNTLGIDDVISQLNNIPENNVLLFLLDTTKDITFNIPLLDIINGGNYLDLIEGIKLSTKRANEISLTLDKSLLGLDQDLELIVKYSSNEIESISIKNLAVSGLNANLTINVNDFDANNESSRLSIAEPKFSYNYFDMNNIGLLLKIGINTTNTRNYHLEGKFILDVPDIAAIQKDIKHKLMFKISVLDNGKVNAYICLQDGRVDANRNTWRQTEFFIDDTDEAIIRQFRNDTGLNLGTAKSEYRTIEVTKVTQKEVLQNIHYYLLRYALGMGDTAFNAIDDAIMNPSDSSSSSDSPLNIKYENVISNIAYYQSEGRFNLQLDLSKIVEISALSFGKLDLDIYHDSSYQLSRLHIHGKKLVVIIGILNIDLNLDVNLIKDSFNMNEYNNFMNLYNSNSAWNTLGYYEYRDKSNNNFFQERLKIANIESLYGAPTEFKYVAEIL